ncbi:hypothetical protein, partial [Thermococcus sp.]
IALKNKKIKEEHLANATAKVIHTHALDRKVYAIPGEVKPEDLEHPRLTGYLTKKFDEVINEDNIPKLAKTWVEGLREAEIYGVSEEEVEQYMRKAREIAKKIKKYLHGDRVSTRDLGKENPMIWSALNVEEFRQFLAEISGKKIEAKKPKSTTVKGTVRQKKEKKGTPETVKLEAQKLLGLLSGLKFAGYSSDAVKNAVEGLELEVERLSENPVENLELIGLYYLVTRALERGDFEGAEELLKSLSGR